MLALAAAGLVIAVVFAFVTPRLAEQPPLPTPTPATSSTRSSPTARTTPPAVTTWSFGDFLSDVDLDLFARSATSLYRIQTRRGRVTATRVGSFENAGMLSFVATPDRVLLVNWGQSDGVVVPDGKAARPLTGLLSEASQIHPGPDGQVWVGTDAESQSTMRLADGFGRPTGVVIRGGGSALSADGRGGLLVIDIGGSYLATRRGLERISRGMVTAIGPKHFIIVDCDARHRCSSYLYDRATRQHRRIGPVRADQSPYGTVSADGRYAALASWLPQASGRELTVVDTRSGRPLTKLASPGPVDDNGSYIWLPDGRLVGIDQGRLFMFDPRSGALQYPDLKLPEALAQLTLRGRF